MDLPKFRSYLVLRSEVDLDSDMGGTSFDSVACIKRGQGRHPEGYDSWMLAVAEQQVVSLRDPLSRLLQLVRAPEIERLISRSIDAVLLVVVDWDSSSARPEFILSPELLEELCALGLELQLDLLV